MSEAVTVFDHGALLVESHTILFGNSSMLKGNKEALHENSDRPAVDRGMAEASTTALVENNTLTSGDRTTLAVH